jgi:hypothetical protein
MLYNLFYNLKNETGGAVANTLRPLSAKLYLFFLVMFNIVNWSAVYLISERASGQLLVLHYNVDFGPDWMGQASQLYVMPIIGTIFLALNLLLVLTLYRRSDIRVLSHFLLGGALVVNFFLVVALGPIYLINFVY